MKQAVINFWTKAFVFTGRARRSEYWLNLLFNLLVGLVLSALFFMVDAILAYRYHLIEHFYFFQERYSLTSQPFLLWHKLVDACRI
ncbi:DUF805 domain-containing protein [Macrococcoides caseolyticum]|uniref:DUF805 domain-containing protein n=1 Tax=Macrococcoides caseolyticum TaxID=69966 RepID=UPI003B02EA9C